MSANAVWQIAIGDYELALDRRALTYRLTDTKTGTVWADGLSVGWMELVHAETGAAVRHDFGTMRLVSLSEKSGHQGKRILFGLDCQGVPVDLYFTCSPREIQLTVEASRDTREWRVGETCLFPGLVSVPDDGGSYLVLPHGDGAMLRAADLPSTLPRKLGIWEPKDGITMPFIGAVRCEGGDVRAFRAALCLITDSVYGNLMMSRSKDGSATVDAEYERDPERRRLDVRIIPLPEANHAGVARAYREKIIGERSHVTLRKKIRDRPLLERAIGAAFFLASGSLTRDDCADLGVDNCLLAAEDSEDGGANAILAPEVSFAFSENRWDAMETQLDWFRERKDRNDAIFGTMGTEDWASASVDWWFHASARYVKGASLPLQSVIYRDSVVRPISLSAGRRTAPLRALLTLSPPLYADSRRSLDPTRRHAHARREYIRRTFAVLGPLHRLTFTAFLTGHRFLTPDMQVEEAVYSDKTRVVINGSDTDDWENDRFALPPGGFYVEHPQMVAHFADRIGEETFAKPAWRIARSLDGKPLSESGDVLRQEFEVKAGL